MDIHRVMAALLGVLLQVAMLGAGVTVAPAAETCATHAACCCGGSQSCHCVESSGDESPSEPAIPAGKERQSPVFVAPHPEITISGTAPHPPAKLQDSPSAVAFDGYCGIALRVAFCRFTI